MYDVISTANTLSLKYRILELEALSPTAAYGTVHVSVNQVLTSTGPINLMI